MVARKLDVSRFSVRSDAANSSALHQSTFFAAKVASIYVERVPDIGSNDDFRKHYHFRKLIANFQGPLVNYNYSGCALFRRLALVKL
jgi:hypothetical protein